MLLTNFDNDELNKYEETLKIYIKKMVIKVYILIVMHFGLMGQKIVI